jgi:hypothetical protein
LKRRLPLPWQPHADALVVPAKTALPPDRAYYFRAIPPKQIPSSQRPALSGDIVGDLIFNTPAVHSAPKQRWVFNCHRWKPAYQKNPLLIY